MRHLRIYLAAVAVAIVPAVLGLWGNASFSQDVPVRVPVGVQSDDTAHARPTPSATARPTPSVTARPTSAPLTPRRTDDDRPGDRGRDHPEDDATTTSSGASPRPRASHPSPHHDVGDDHGGDRSGRGGSDDDGGRHGSDDRSGSGGGSGGHGSDD